LLENGNAPLNAVRWYNFIKSLDHVDSFLGSIPDEAKPKFGITYKTAARSGRKDEGKFVDLPGAEEGKLVVRFPPEASGYVCFV
jgi:bifunctional glutamyl/prolyl-tRNA synthetase